MTEKLYETQPYLKTFSAEVVSCVPCKGGWEVELDRTAFYPEGGGQPCDLGTLGAARVTDVHARDGRVLHTVTAPLTGAVTGSLDWARRFDHMQQHSGEHLVSGIAHRLYGVENVGFHMGKDLITIDFDRVLSPEELFKVERLANEAVWANLETKITVWDSEAACPLDYRSKKALTGPVRVVEFPGADRCACCGTHVAHTGEIGLIKLFPAVKFHQGIRIELACGGRALGLLNTFAAQNREVSGLLSAKPTETAAAVRRTLDELAAEKQRAAALEMKWLAGRIMSLAGEGDLLLFEPDLDPDALRRFCAAAMEVRTGLTAVFSGGDGEGYAYVIGTAKTFPQGEGKDLRTFAKTMNAALHGRGGGKPDFIQGRVGATMSQIETFFQNETMKEFQSSRSDTEILS